LKSFIRCLGRAGCDHEVPLFTPHIAIYPFIPADCPIRTRLLDGPLTGRGADVLSSLQRSEEPAVRHVGTLFESNDWVPLIGERVTVHPGEVKANSEPYCTREAQK